MILAVPELFRRELDGRFPVGVDASWYHDLDDLPHALEGADVLVIGFIDAAEIRAAIAAAPHVRWVSSHAAGVDHYPFDHAALAESLQAGQPRGAYLDVTEPEPLPTEHPLRGLPNVFITGHSAGRSPRSHQRYATRLLDNVDRFRAGQRLRNIVDLVAGY